MSDSPFDHRPAAGVSDPGLARLLTDEWEARMARYPTWASRLGDRRYESLLGGVAPEDHDAARAENAAFLARARDLVEDRLSPSDRLTLRLIRHNLETSRAVMACCFDQWSVNPRGTPVGHLAWLPEIRTYDSPADARSLLDRYRAMEDVVRGDMACLSIGAAAGKFANREAIRRSIELMRTELEKPVTEWAAATRISIAADGSSKEERDEFRREAVEVLQAFVRPALAEYVEFLERELLPHGRTGAEEGLHAMPGGREAYEVLIREHTTLTLSPEEIHEIGKREIASIHEEFAELGMRTLGTKSVPEIFERLRTDPAFTFDTAEEVEAKAVSALEKARRAMPEWFGRLPAADCVVKRIPDHEAPFTTIAYYRPPAGDGSSPGEYRVNVYAPETRPRYEAEVLAFHEAIPGHHLQIAVARELPEMPAFRRCGHVNAYLEGWALYTERLADEMGLYESDLDRLGMLSFDAWRASRLVVDTGVHAFGWTREQAIEYMTEVTPLAGNNIDNEVDRYIAWPAQALSYKLGQIAMWRLRREMDQKGVGVREFHDRVLALGPVPLSILRTINATDARP
jgi:uncharacterized protein (DUF885 family)